MRDACGEAAVSYIADAAIVACDYAESVGHAIEGMLAKWDELGLRSHSAAAATLDAMATMPAAGVVYLSEATGRSAHSVRRGLRSLVSAGAVAESRDENTGRRVFEVPELLQVVDHRQKLLQVCWHSHQAGLGLSAAELVAEWRRAAVTDNAALQPLARRERCAHIGKRSKVRCTQPAGHPPPHRYT